MTVFVYEFTEYPGLRHCKISDDSGEDFYHKILNEKFYEAYVNKKKLIVDLDNTSGYAPSFLDEAFGNLIFDFSKKIVEDYLEIISNQEPDLLELIYNETYIQWEERRIKNETPKKTATHEPWYRLENGNLITTK